MKRTSRVAVKIIVSGTICLILFIISFYLLEYLLPPTNHPDVVGSWGAGLLMIIGTPCSMFLAGALATLFTYKDMTSSREIFTFPIFSGLVAAILPLLFIISQGHYTGPVDPQFFGTLYFFGTLFVFGTFVLIICMFLSLLGGLSTYFLLNLMGAILRKLASPNP